MNGTELSQTSSYEVILAGLQNPNEDSFNLMLDVSSYYDNIYFGHKICENSVNLPTSVFDSVRALTATIAAELGETAVGSDHYGALFTIGIFLFIITFVINLTADLIVRGIRKG